MRLWLPWTPRQPGLQSQPARRRGQESMPASSLQQPAFGHPQGGMVSHEGSDSTRLSAQTSFGKQETPVLRAADRRSLSRVAKGRLRRMAGSRYAPASARVRIELVEQLVRGGRGLVLKEPGHRHRRVQHEFQTHRRPSFLHSLLRLRVARSLAMASPMSWRGGRLTGTSRAISVLCRVITSSSPRPTRSTSSDSLFLASGTNDVSFHPEARHFLLPGMADMIPARVLSLQTRDPSAPGLRGVKSGSRHATTSCPRMISASVTRRLLRAATGRRPRRDTAATR